MADLSTRLPTEIDSAQRFVDPGPATPSIFESLANFGSGIAQVADKTWTQLDKNAAKRNAAADEAAKGDAARIIAGAVYPSINPQTPVSTTVTGDPGHDSAVAAAKPAAATANNFQQAASQGTIDLASAQARGLAAMRAVMAAHPGHEAAVAAVFKEMGVQNMITQQYDNAETAFQDNAKAQRDTINKLNDAAVNKWGFTNFYQMSPEEQAIVRAQVGLSELKETQLDMQSKQASIALQGAQLSAEQLKTVQTQTSGSLATTFSQYMTTSFQNLMKISLNNLNDPTLANDPARLEKLQSQLLATALPAMDVQFQNKLSSLGSNLTESDRNFLTNNYNTMKQSFIGMLSGPQSVVEQNKRIMEDLSNTYGIQYAQSAPTLLKLQKLIGPQALGVLLSPSIQGNPQLSKMLGDELKGAIADPTKVASFSEFVQTLNGSIDPSTWDPQKVVSMAPAQLQAMVALSKNTPATNGTDKEGHLALVNSVKNTAGIAVDVVPQWGFKNILMQGKALNQVGVTTALFHSQGANQGEKIDAVRAWIPAVTRTYAALQRTDAGDQFYSAQLDPHTLTWKAVWNGKAETRAMPGVGTPVSINDHPSPTTAILEKVSTMNTMLNNLSVSAAKGYDDVLGKGVSYQDARRFYATGQLPQSVERPVQKNGKTPEQNVNDAVSHMLDFVNNMPAPSNPTTSSGKGPAPAIENKADMDAYYNGPGKANLANYQKYAPAVATAAAAHGVPLGVAMNLIHTESKFNPNADSGEAHGLGQISYKTASRMGLDLKALTPEQNLDHSMAILSDNFKATGNWQDAAAMYLTGRTIAKAGNAKDKNGTTAPVYAAAVVPSTPTGYNWDPVYAAGYTRY